MEEKINKMEFLIKAIKPKIKKHKEAEKTLERLTDKPEEIASVYVEVQGLNDTFAFCVPKGDPRLRHIMTDVVRVQKAELDELKTKLSKIL